MSHRITKEAIDEAVHKVLSPQKPRNFLETIEMQISLKDIDVLRDKRFNSSVRLKHVIKPSRKICVLGDDALCEESARLGIASMNRKEIESYNKDAKRVKKTAQKFNNFLAPASIITLIPRYFGPGLNRAGKFPTVIAPNEKLADKVEDLMCTAKFQLKKTLCLGVAIGNAKMTEEELKENFLTSINFLASILKKNWNNIAGIVLKSTMGKPHRVL
uniref:Large ribosomal subunit protein uL1 n=1 Tax=Dermatophagoides pteronyssinus TaxID=6956 RepID=A0A6P6XXF0_DERPT|nr:60S ribosomal protein L10a-3-like [Dermatophagoides pteronyssinus]